VEAIIGELVVKVGDCGWRISKEGTSTSTKATLGRTHGGGSITRGRPGDAHGRGTITGSGEGPLGGAGDSTRDGEIAQGSEDMAWHCG